MSPRKREPRVMSPGEAVGHLRERVLRLSQTHYSHNWSRWTYQDYLAAKILLEQNVHGGLSCDAAEEDRSGLAHGYAELPGLRAQIAQLQEKLDKLTEATRIRVPAIVRDQAEYAWCKLCGGLLDYTGVIDEKNLGHSERCDVARVLQEKTVVRDANR